MPYFADNGSNVWFPLVFPILFPIIFPMGFMMFFMMRRGGPMGMMMGGHQPPPPDDHRPLTRPTPPERPPGSGDTLPHPETPLEVAQRRYAAGEISRNEFQRIREDLGAP